MSGVTYLSNGDAQCTNCGNVWDGNAQCNCWQWMYSAFDEFGEFDQSSDDDSDDDEDDDEDVPDDLTDFGHTDSEDIDSDDEYDDFNDIAINLNTIFDNIEVE
jgi:hypothetical protein